MQVNLNQQICLVTGASRGIGRAIALQMAHHGATVAFNYQSRADLAEGLVHELTNAGGKALAIQSDVSNAEQVDGMVQQIRSVFGPISILVNNAGINRDRTFVKMSRAEWDEVIGVNLTGNFIVTKAVIADMLEAKNGRIINVSSIVGQRGNFGQANYAASKAGVIGMTKTLALEFARKGITVNAIAPGFIETDMTAGIPIKVIEQIQSTIPVARMGTADEVAHAACFLASQEACYITGQVIPLNGGLYM
ncbi:3-oxoacyl-[acyl-carrier-protein] reductase [bacterium]|nr:3-oxoacyl-[acyl-carrier-protein] reductase [bacterium]